MLQVEVVYIVTRERALKILLHTSNLHDTTCSSASQLCLPFKLVRHTQYFDTPETFAVSPLMALTAPCVDVCPPLFLPEKNT
jgi:hypothetical protein